MMHKYDPEGRSRMSQGEKLLFVIVLVGLTLLGIGFFMVSFRFGCIALGIGILGTAWKIMAWRRD